jgi:hypothetical protein
MSRQTALQLATAGAVVGASGAAYLAYSSFAAKQTKDIIVFLDGSKTGISLAQQELPLLLASLEQQLHIRDARVFLLQVSSRKVNVVLSLLVNVYIQRSRRRASSRLARDCATTCSRP